MDTFIHDDDGYLAWLHGHPNGFVINCGAPPVASYVILHRASCRTVTGTPTSGARWTASYQKVCATTVNELDAWSMDKVGVHPKRCGICAP